MNQRQLGRLASRSISHGLALVSLGLFVSGSAMGADPFAMNNTVYPTAEEWKHGFRSSNYNYPSEAIKPSWKPGAGLKIARSGLDQTTAPQYVDAVKAFLQANDIEGLVTEPLTWNPADGEWYSMPWGGEGSKQADGSVDPETGREPLLGSNAGQIIRSSTFYTNPPNVDSFQNHSVVYYNDVSAAMLGRVWANPFDPDPALVDFPEGSVIVKVEGAAVEGWAPLAGAPVSYVYRPTVEDIHKLEKGEIEPPLKPQVIPMQFAQMAVKIKDKKASPDTGWVFMGFTWDAGGPGSDWDRVVAVGATWGNDPDCADNFDGHCPDKQPLQEVWVNGKAPKFIHDSLGWGGRLAAPMDVARRHNVVTLGGQRYSGDEGQVFAASACMSCHGSAQYPFVANLYPSPNMVFPEDGKPFLFFDPGSEEWADWFQNRKGDEPMSGAGHEGIVALDFDMMITLALMTALSGAGEDAFLNHTEFGH